MVSEATLVAIVQKTDVVGEEISFCYTWTSGVNMILGLCSNKISLDLS